MVQDVGLGSVRRSLDQLGKGPSPALGTGSSPSTLQLAEDETDELGDEGAGGEADEPFLGTLDLDQATLDPPAPIRFVGLGVGAAWLGARTRDAAEGLS
jgi:hypothetical protein